MVRWVRLQLGAALILLLLGAAGPAAAQFSAPSDAFAAGDYASALQGWRPLAEGGDANAQFGVGVIYDEGGDGVAQDFALAAAWYSKAARQGLAEAQFNLGHLYRLGRGVEEDPRQAVAWYLKAATQGLAAAQYNVALSYETGSGAGQNYTVAAKWYRQAAEQGNLDAQLGLAALYRYGLGVPGDRDTAIAWYERAAGQGDPRAHFHLAAMAAELEARKQEPSKQESRKQEPEKPKKLTKTAAQAAPEPPAQQAAAAPAPLASGSGPVFTAVAEEGTPAEDDFVVQLAAHRRAESADAAWLRLREAHPDLLGGLKPAVRPANLGGDAGIVYRLVAGPLPTKARARDLCARLRERNVDCFVPRE